MPVKGTVFPVSITTSFAFGCDVCTEVDDPGDDESRTVYQAVARMRKKGWTVEAGDPRGVCLCPVHAKEHRES